MWKLVVGFIIFAALALYMLSRGGDIDLGGEKHGSACSFNCALSCCNRRNPSIDRLLFKGCRVANAGRDRMYSGLSL